MDDYLDDFDAYDDFEPDASGIEAYISDHENRLGDQRKCDGFTPPETFDRYDGDFEHYFYSDDFL